jgi:hypothetical protein
MMAVTQWRVLDKTRQYKVPRLFYFATVYCSARWDAVGLLKRTAVKLAVRDEAREHWGPPQVTDTSQKRHGFNYNKVTLFVPDPVSHHR